MRTVFTSIRSPKTRLSHLERSHPKYKEACDSYFYLPHRDETRGIGGLFFDDFNELGFEQSFAFMRAVGNAFVPAYVPIVTRRKTITCGIREREFQLIEEALRRTI